MTREELDKLGKIIVDACFSVHIEMGPGLLEAIYEMCLIKELELRGIKAIRQVPIPLIYKGYKLIKKYKVDVLVENEIIVEIKAVEHALPVHKAQIISHLKLADKRLGYLVNFNVPLIKEGIQRLVNNF